VEFLVISVFHETKIQMVDMKVHVYSKFSKNKISKKVKSPNSMRNGRFDTSKLGGSLKKWVYCAPILPKALAHSPNFQKKIQKNIKNSKKKGPGRPYLGVDPQHRLGPFFLEFFFLLPFTFCTSGQHLQLMPALPRVHLKTSNIQNF
jgi:hypothetical protein